MNSKKSISTDWLNSKPVFYNNKINNFSNNMFNLIEGNELSFDKEGLKSYFDFGYSVFQQTPIKEIKFLEPCRSIELDNNKLKIHNLDDPLDKYINYKLSEDEIFELIKQKVQKWESSLPKDQLILLPLSGGYDSRILINSITNKDRVRAFTYGLSTKQELSTETIKAKYLCNKFGINWTQIELGKYNEEINNWIKLYGLSTHAHGMYHIEFYKNIKKLYPNTKFSVLSGIVGDAWAGSLPTYNIKSFKDLNYLGLTRGLNADSNYILNNTSDMTNKKRFFEDNKDKLQDYRYQIVILIQTKMILLSYLLNLPKNFGYECWSPYLEIDIALAMINLDKDRRTRRKWQKEFFKKNNLYLEDKINKGDPKNLLHQNSAININLEPLDYSLLENKIDISYLKFINKNISLNKLGLYFNEILNIPKVGGFLKKTGFKSKFLEAYFAYLCIYPIQYVLKNR